MGLKDIFDYIAKDSKKYAHIHILRLKGKTKILKTNPRIGRLVPELDREDIRELIEGNYRIKSSKRIDIITIYHSARLLNLDKLI